MAQEISGIGTILSEFTQKQDKQWVTEARRHRIAAAAGNIIHCDGELSSQTRNYLYDIDLLIPQFQNDMEAVVQIVKRTVTGSLGREVLRYIADSTETVQWSQLKEHIERTFLSADEPEVLRQIIDGIVQGAAETLASYNRRFREAVSRAYGTNPSEDAERTIIKLYLRNLKSVDMARKTSLEVPTPTLTAILKFTDNLEAGLQRFAALQRRDEEPMDLSPADEPLTRIQMTLDAVVADQRSLRQAIDQATSQRAPPRMVDRQNVSANPPPQFSRTRQPKRQRPTGNRDRTCYLCSGTHLAYECPHIGEFRKHLTSVNDTKN